MAPTACAPLPAQPVPPPVPPHEPHLPSLAAYHALYARSIADPSAFWRDIADEFTWHSKSNFDPAAGPVHVSFLPDRRTNVAYNALDRWISAGHGARVAFYAEGNEPGRRRVVTYADLADSVARMGNVLRARGVRKGDVVVLYMPMVPELPAAMLACARIGAVHSVVFGGFSSEALAGRIVDSKANVVVVTEAIGRGKKQIQLKAIADRALEIAEAAGHRVEHQIVTKVPGAESVSDEACMVAGRDVDWDEAVREADAECEVEWVESEHPLFVLYTSGSTGKPKGVVHSTGGYMVYAATTFKYTFDYHEGDVFFSTSDCGWITGHSYVTYGPLLNGATQVLYEGVPNYPTPARLWEICEHYGVNQLYTAPTVIRALKGAAPPPQARDGKAEALRVLGTVGEPINPEAWMWYYEVVGARRCAIVDTWWQTETGGHAMTPLPIPGLQMKPGCAMMPFFGIQAALLNGDGAEVEGEGEGLLVIKSGWPAALRTVYGDHGRMEEAYFGRFPGYYMTGDGARRDADGHYWLTGRVDDILNVSGHRIGTAEVESALVLHHAVAEAAVVSVGHAVKGESLYAFVSLMGGVEASGDLRAEIRACVRNEIGAFAAPDAVHWAPALPKTRSGKIMRRILRKIAAGGARTRREDLGDTSTLTDPSVVDALLDTFGK
ncbi:acetyl-CoA synthetase [Chondrus crispus]|uniref:Acetyl-coenzyme A synthetase n=1 Tax=Chondrus crispus TaxID=2769 RepID=R7Q328_CHOCR|nr:acetyl-CoA synthetase [Chondrus crispus]CDF32952.1 acetyl-CoA synthetase [Chondrus crispus]|eukprot:XP_005712755.1 acetyl-CoA synthetase [Chondrus crispus]